MSSESEFAGADAVRIGGYSLEVATPAGSFARFEPEPESKNARALAAALEEEPEQRPFAAIEEFEASAQEVTGRIEEAEGLLRTAAEGRLLDPANLTGEIDSLLGLLERLDKSGRFEEELALMRSLNGLLALSLRWLELVRSLRSLLASAEALGHKAAQAWAHHELGSLHLCAGNAKRRRGTSTRRSGSRSRWATWQAVAPRATTSTPHGGSLRGRPVEQDHSAGSCSPPCWQHSSSGSGRAARASRTESATGAAEAAQAIGRSLSRWTRTSSPTTHVPRSKSRSGAPKAARRTPHRSTRARTRPPSSRSATSLGARPARPPSARRRPVIRPTQATAGTSLSPMATPLPARSRAPAIRRDRSPSPSRRTSSRPAAPPSSSRSRARGADVLTHRRSPRPRARQPSSPSAASAPAEPARPRKMRRRPAIRAARPAAATSPSPAADRPRARSRTPREACHGHLHRHERLRARRAGSLGQHLGQLHGRRHAERRVEACKRRYAGRLHHQRLRGRRDLHSYRGCSAGRLHQQRTRLRPSRYRGEALLHDYQQAQRDDLLSRQGVHRRQHDQPRHRPHLRQRRRRPSSGNCGRGLAGSLQGHRFRRRCNL